MKKKSLDKEKLRETIEWYLAHFEGVTGQNAAHTANDLMKKIDRIKSSRKAPK